jgi:enolase-phosphatase E1
MDAALHEQRHRQGLSTTLHGADVHPRLALNDVRAILLDIEGTTTPIEFVHQVLFPYARARVREHLGPRDVVVLREEYRAEAPAEDLPVWNPADETASAEAYVYWLMDRDRKSTGLKALQGRIWEAGYRAGELQGKGEVYPDVRPALARWRDAGKTIAIFSSGSVQAQRNLFANTTDGDLSPFLSGYFDTTTGPKREPPSYRRIAAELRRAPEEVLFVSDVAAELDAARAAGMRTALCVRGSEAPPVGPAGDHPRIRSFAELA